MKMYNFDFAVIVCTYNSNYDKLKKTLNSIFKQKGVKFQVIISDDGSKYNSYNEITKWLTTNNFQCDLNFLNENVGTINNILSALKLCDAKYIKVISPGDYLHSENTLFDYYSCFERNDADLVFGKAVYYFEDKILKSMSPYNINVFNNRNLKTKIIKFNDYVLGASIATKSDLIRDILNKISGKMKFLEDVPLCFLSLLNEKKVIAMDEKTVWYEFGTGISTKPEETPLLKPDYQYFYQYLLDNYKINIVKKSYKMFIANQINNKIFRLIKKTLISPSFIFYFISSKFNRRNKDKDSIGEMYKIIGDDYIGL